MRANPDKEFLAVMKSVPLLVFAFCLSLLMSPLQADTYGYFTYVVNGASITITDYPEWAVGSVSIPASINGKPVTAIGNAAFEECQSLTSVTIPEGVTTVGDSAFGYCLSLQSISLPSSLTSIGDYAFALPQYTNSPETLPILPPNLTSIGEGAFVNWYLLKEITIPASVTSIGAGAFANCVSLARAWFLGNAPLMGEAVFRGAGRYPWIYGVKTIVHRLADKTGFTTPEWMGYPTTIVSSPPRKWDVWTYTDNGPDIQKGD
jgi:hypothetical protein